MKWFRKRKQTEVSTVKEEEPQPLEVATKEETQPPVDSHIIKTIDIDGMPIAINNTLNRKRNTMNEIKKTVFVISPYHGDGKTTLIETLCGQELKWHEEDIKGIYHWQCAEFRYMGYCATIKEGEPISTEKHQSVWPELAEQMLHADLILYVWNSKHKPVLTDTDDFFEQKIEGKSLADIVMSKRLLVFTQDDQKPDFGAWWNKLSEEKKAELNAINSNPNCGTYVEALIQEWALCTGLWVNLNVDQLKDIFEVSVVTHKEIVKLRERIVDELFRDKE